MSSPLVVVSGFGPYEEVRENPSGRAALELAVRAPRGVRVVGGVLPTSFRRAPLAFDWLLLGLPRPAALLALGMHRGESFRLERRAGGRTVRPDRPDVDGGVAADVGDAGEERAARADVDALAACLVAAGAPRVERSEDAGGYVCERTYHHVLGRAAELDVPAVFLHVPPPWVVPVGRQVELLAALVARLVAA